MQDILLLAAYHSWCSSQAHDQTATDEHIRD